jgi:hypothetical protein
VVLLVVLAVWVYDFEKEMPQMGHLGVVVEDQIAFVVNF